MNNLTLGPIVSKQGVFPNIHKRSKSESKEKNKCHSHSFCGDVDEIQHHQINNVDVLNQPVIALANNESQDVAIQTPSKRTQNELKLAYDQITEEALDDWIAQSFNRPIISFLDPYRKFYAPPSIIQTFKQRYKKLYISKEMDHLKKKLYFDEVELKRDINRLYQQQIGQMKENKDITFQFKKLSPKNIMGTSIVAREQFNLRKRRNQSVMQGNQQNNNSFFGGDSRLQGKNNLIGALKQQIENFKDNGKSEFIKILKNENFKESLIQTETGKEENNKINKFVNSKISSPEKNNMHKTSPKDKLNQTTSSFEQTEQNFFSPEKKTLEIKSPEKINSPKQDDWSRELRKYLNARIDKLLEESEVDQTKNIIPDLADLKLHVPEILEINKPKNNMDNIDFTFYRAIRRIQKGTYDAAIPQLKQVLNFNKLHFATIFNLACMYERLKKYETAKKWFDVAQKFPPSENRDFEDQINYGIALCHYKQNQLSESLDLVQKLCEKQQDEDEKNKEYTYLRCLISKLMQNYEQAQIDYSEFIYFTCPKNFFLLMKLMFAIVFKNLRKLTVKYDPLLLCEFNTVVHQILASEVMEEKLIPYYDFNKKVFNLDKSEVVQKLHNQSFFKRFQFKQLTDYFEKMNFNVFEKRKVIFPSQDQVFIITAGHCAVYDHRQDFRIPDIIAYYTEGDIIGCDDKDNHISQNPDLWFVCLTKVEYFTISRHHFNDLWKLHINDSEKMKFLQNVMNNDLFKNVSHLGLYRMCFELFEKVEFQKGDIIFNDGESIEKYHGITLIKKDLKGTSNFVNRLQDKFEQFDFSKLKIGGFYVILKGQVELESPKNWLHYTLTEGGYFGENLLFSTLGISRFGRLKAATNKVTCLFIRRDKFHLINLLDKEEMKANCRKSEYFKKCQAFLYKYYKTQKSNDE